jgi:hypothetical protein
MVSNIHKIKKVNAECQVRQKRVQEAVEEALTYSDEDEEIPIPSDLEEQIREQLDGSAKAWDHVLWDLVADDESEDEDREDSEDGESPGHRPPGAAAGPGSVHAREYVVGVTTE